MPKHPRQRHRAHLALTLASSCAGHMRRTLLVLAAALLVVVMPSTVSAQPLRYGPDTLKLVERTQVDDRRVDLTFTTPAVVGETPVSILLPRGYRENTTKRYPVVWLLHGSMSPQDQWLSAGDAVNLTKDTQSIYVFPYGGDTVGNTDWYNGGAFGPPAWLSYHLGQLLPWVDANFRTIADRGHRAVAGLSQGGYGAANYASAYPDLFGAAASFSGPVDQNSATIWSLEEAQSQQRGHGPHATQEIRYRDANPWDLAENLGSVDFTLLTRNGLPGGPGGGNCSTGDPIEMEVHQETVSLHKRLEALGIRHHYEDQGAGGHCFYFWQRDLAQWLTHLNEFFADPPAAPDTIVHKTTDPQYRSFGWDVKIDRSVLEFSKLTAARSTFSLAGSGQATITTPPLYKANSTVRLRVSDAAGVATRPAQAGSDCRLSVPVSLGASNPYQQYSPEARASVAQDQLTSPGELLTAPAVDGTEVRVAEVRVLEDPGACSTPNAAATSGPSTTSATSKVCRSRRSFTATLRAPKGQRTVSASAKLDGKKVATTRSVRSVVVRVRLTGLVKSTVKLVIKAQLRSGRTISTTRTYHPCVARRTSVKS